MCQTLVLPLLLLQRQWHFGCKAIYCKYFSREKYSHHLTCEQLWRIQSLLTTMRLCADRHAKLEGQDARHLDRAERIGD